MLLNTLFHDMPLNERGRDFVVGDIHGHAALLDHLLTVVAFDPSADRLIALGDLIDRGPDGRKLLERVRDEPWFYSLRGNHEAMLMSARYGAFNFEVWEDNGGGWGRDLSPEEHEHLAAIAAGLPLAMALPLPDGRRIGLIHAELHPRHVWQDLEDLRIVLNSETLDGAGSWLESAALWGRTRIHAAAMAHAGAKGGLTSLERETLQRALEPVAGIDQIISGHTILRRRQPLSASNLLFIDTGAFQPTGRLTLVEPLTRRYWQTRYIRTGAVGVIRRSGSCLPAPLCLKAVIPAQPQ